MIEPRRGVDAALLYEKLCEAQRTSFNVFVGDSDARKVVPQYLRWVGECELLLRMVLESADVDRVLMTRRYWATLANQEFSTVNLAAVRQEVQDRQAMFDELARAVETERKRWTAPDPETYFIVADTNVYLHHPDELVDVDWRAAIDMANRVHSTVRLVIPLVVVDELDDHKRNETRTRARLTLKALWDAFGAEPTRPWIINPAGEAGGKVTAELLVDNPGHHRLDRPDDELVDRALLLSAFVGVESLRFISYDTGAAFRARASGLVSHRLTQQP